jgi:hypothetical protein
MKTMDCSRESRGFFGSTALVGILLAGFVISSPSLARAQDGAVAAAPRAADAETRLRVQDVHTDRALLVGLERRRAALGANSERSPATREAIAFLDNLIQQLWNRIGKDMESLGQAS